MAPRVRSTAVARIEPLHTVRYELSAVGSLQEVLAPPYDVIDPPFREELAARSPFNVVEIDLPEAPLHVRGEVRWVEDCPTRAGIGIRFHPMAVRDRLLLANYVLRRSFG